MVGLAYTDVNQLNTLVTRTAPLRGMSPDGSTVNKARPARRRPKVCKPKVDVATRQDIVARYNSGESAATLGEDYGLDRRTVHRFVK